MPEPRPRVLLAIGGLGLGGSERQLMRLVSAAHPEKFEASILTFSTDCAAAHAQRLDELGVNLVQFPPAGVPRALRPAISIPRTVRLLRRLRPDVIYAWLEETATIITPAANALGIPVVIARRSVCGSPAERHPPYRAAIRWAERRAEVVTGNSDAVLAEAEARGVDRERLRLVRNGHPEVPALGPPAGETVALGYLANYRPEKGHRRLLDALALVDTRSPWRADLAGSGPLRERIAVEAAERGLSDRVKVGEAITDIRAFWADHHLAVLLSDDEGSPNALIEAAMFGRPVVGTNAGGTPEVIADDGGILVSHEPAAIAEALERLIESPDLRQSLGAGARHHASSRYDLAKSVEGHLEALREALDRRGSP